MENRPFVKKKLGGKWVIYLNTEIGNGTFSKAYIAKPLPKQDIQYACKLIDKKVLAQNFKRDIQYLIKRIDVEIHILQKVDHCNLVKLVDFCQSKSNIYIIMEYCECDLFQYLANHALSFQKLVILMKGLADGCLYLHHKNILHRDLKPSNIFMNKHHPKIGDFGLSKILENGQAEIMKSGTKVGSPLYMSPQVLNEERYTIKCDVWSLGIIFYEMLFKKLPFGLRKQCCQKQILDRISRQGLNLQQTKEDLKKLFKGMLQIKEEQRWNMLRVQKVLEQFVAPFINDQQE